MPTEYVHKFGLMFQMVSTVLNIIMFEECRNQWSMSRPLLGLILLNEEVSNPEYINNLTSNSYYLYHSVWANQRLAPVLQISCNPVYKWLLHSYVSNYLTNN